MTMTVYKKIKALLELNTLRGVGVKYASGEWKIFTYLRENGILEGTRKEESIEDCLRRGLVGATYTEKEINNKFTHNIVPIPMKPKVLPEGTMVKILDIVEEVKGYEDSLPVHRNIRSGEIISTHDDDFGVYYRVFYGNDDHTCGFSKDFPAYCVVPDFSEESEAHKKAEELEKQAEDMLKKAKELRESL